jgi:hypothetical protein
MSFIIPILDFHAGKRNDVFKPHASICTSSSI